MDDQASRQQKGFPGGVLGRILCGIVFLGASATLWVMIFSATHNYAVEKTVESYSQPKATSPSEKPAPTGLEI